MSATLRVLDDFELDAVVGVDDSSGGDIIVTGYNPWITYMSYDFYMQYYYQDPNAQYYYPAPTGGGGGGSGGPSAAAMSYAAAHIKNEGTTPADAQYYQQAVNDLAKFFDYAEGHLNDSINIGNNQTVTYATVLGTLGREQIHITDDTSLAGTSGARSFFATDSSSANTYINPQNADQQTYMGSYDGTSGMDYVIFHEIGHVINMASNSVAPQDEGSANTTGRSIEMNLGMTLLSQNGNAVTPGNGYH